MIDNLIKIKDKLSDIIFSSDEAVNISYKNLIIFAINKNFAVKANEIQTSLIEIKEQNDINNHKLLEEKINVIVLLDLFISWFPNEIAKNWTKMCSFLEVKYIDKNSYLMH